MIKKYLISKNKKYPVSETHPQSVLNLQKKSTHISHKEKLINICSLCLKNLHISKDKPRMTSETLYGLKIKYILLKQGDQFLQNKDYYSALNAYSQALRLDANNINCLMNRSVVNMHLFNFEEILRDNIHIIETCKNILYSK